MKKAPKYQKNHGKDRKLLFCQHNCCSRAVTPQEVQELLTGDHCFLTEHIYPDYANYNPRNNIYFFSLFQKCALKCHFTRGSSYLRSW